MDKAFLVPWLSRSQIYDSYSNQRRDRIPEKAARQGVRNHLKNISTRSCPFHSPIFPTSLSWRPQSKRIPKYTSARKRGVGSKQVSRCVALMAEGTGSCWCEALIAHFKTYQERSSTSGRSRRALSKIPLQCFWLGCIICSRMKPEERVSAPGCMDSPG